MAIEGGDGTGHVSQAALDRFKFGAPEEAEATEIQAHLGACESCYLRWIGATPEDLAVGQDPAVLRSAAELMLGFMEELRRERLDDAADCAFWALLCALKIPEDSMDPGVVADLRGRIWTEVANLRRVAENFAAAVNALFEARSCLNGGTGNARLDARWFDVAGSLFRDLRYFPAAIEALELAHGMYRNEVEDHLAGRSLVTQSSVLNYAGETSRALASLIEAVPLLDVDRDPRLLFAAAHNILHALVDLAEHEAVSRSLWRFRPLYLRFGSSSDQIRLVWVEARVAVGLGHKARAERLFRRGVSGFRTLGMEYEAALVALDLAVLLLAQNRSGEVLDLLSGEVMKFVERHVYREAFVTLAVLRDAVERGRATERQIRAFAKLLDASRLTLPRP